MPPFWKSLTKPLNIFLKNFQPSDDLLQRQQAELQRLYAAAQAATVAKSNFLANMSHEIRTPMTAILGFTDVLAGNLADSGQEEVREAVGIIKKNGEHLLALLNDILDLSKIEAGKLDVQRVSCSPCQLLADVASLMRVRAQAKGLGLYVEFIGPMPETIVTDPVRLRQILVNLVGNAIKFTEVGEVRLAREWPPPSKARRPCGSTWWTRASASRWRSATVFSSRSLRPTRRRIGNSEARASAWRSASVWPTFSAATFLAQSVAGRGSTFSLTIAAGSMQAVRMLERPSEAVRQSRQASRGRFAPQVRLDCRILLAEDGPDNKRLLTFLLQKAGDGRDGRRQRAGGDGASPGDLSRLGPPLRRSHPAVRHHPHGHADADHGRIRGDEANSPRKLSRPDHRLNCPRHGR